jgi:hypothetical protein
MPIAVDIDVMLARRKMSVGELADRVGITPANLTVLKNGRAKAVRFATLASPPTPPTARPTVSGLHAATRKVSRRSTMSPEPSW